ncbi:hypothetical protein AKS96_28 [Escherichia phage vB_EcoS_AKS96]|uniref:Uncharacterized protein n=6 Tax=Rogunavirus TaxID=1920866 RepID=A0A067YXQ8_9CAUD|nr:hypothetical protein LA65_gp31 [Escherichia phage vB_EcoS_AHS24]YP_009056083.1 hypothetical protein LD31_gp28 [Escherichia phage vB_EcoS_AKS96]YP_009056546.1 hypothetical protein LD32_gp30 [Escherichia phage vB_EcoS_AHP42]AHI60497.1 hypothetical protein AHP24_29 [Escherichia phage bV_EcoS_AHP24]QQM15527.1 hypothetical protein BECP10_00038 [Escherichia phage vB_EcoS-BECP10]WCI99815.1 hypothetical protein UDF157lw_00039 [Escherichia phage vB_EcoS-UDF157lw]AHI60576.1 hypothetical protein AHP4
MAYFIIQERNNPIFGTCYYCVDGSGYTSNKSEAARFETKQEAIEYAHVTDEELGSVMKIIKVKE